jgi:hypothetical protein
MSETILLRPGATLAAAMTAAAEARGISRQSWMLTVLAAACSEYASAITPDDVPLFVAPGESLLDGEVVLCSCPRSGTPHAARECLT